MCVHVCMCVCVCVCVCVPSSLTRCPADSSVGCNGVMSDMPASLIAVCLNRFAPKGLVCVFVCMCARARVYVFRKLWYAPRVCVWFN